MDNIDQYVDAAKAAKNVSSDAALSRFLGMSGNAICQWRTRRTWPSDATMIALCELAGLDPQEGLARLNEWRAGTPKVGLEQGERGR